MWTSLRKPAGNEGRSGRSMSRAVRIARSLARPSRRKNEPGIFPAAYIRSSMSTVSGKKSCPSRTLRAAVAVTSTMVSPMRATTAPSAWAASLPVSNDRLRLDPLIGPATVMASAISLLGCWGTREPVPSRRALERAEDPATGSWRQRAPMAVCGAGASRATGASDTPSQPGSAPRLPALSPPGTRPVDVTRAVSGAIRGAR